jgi:hypothetical protein
MVPFGMEAEKYAAINVKAGYIFCLSETFSAF